MPRVLLIAFVLSVAAAAQAQTKVALVQQGMLLDGSDEPVSSPAVTFGFSIWSDATSSGAASQLWPSQGESECVTAVLNGYYSVVLDGASDGCGAGLTAELLEGETERYLQVSVDGTALLPRARLVTAPSALLATRSRDAEALAARLASSGTLNAEDNPVDWTRLKGVPEGFEDGVDDDTQYVADDQTLSLVEGTFAVREAGISTSQFADGAVTTVKVADGAVTASKLASDAASLEKVSGGALAVTNDSIQGSADLVLGSGARFVGDGSGLTGVDDTTKLAKTGGALTGDLVFSEGARATGLPDPTVDSDAATKGYVDREIATAGFQIGDVKISILTEEQFQTLHGDCWVLLDGRDVTGTDLAALTEKDTLPDARGHFLRGKNNGRDDGRGNPDGELEPGDYQADMLGRHTHPSVRTSVSTDSSCAGRSVTGTNGNGCSGNAFDATNSPIAAAGGNETRPRNTTVNYFVRVNRSCE